MSDVLDSGFFARDTLEVARDLVGCTLWTETEAGRCSGRIVEAEAYLDERDPASHAGRGPTPRSAIMYGPSGVAYVYLIYGMHCCLNAVTEPPGRAGAVLLRAVEPLTGSALMQARRGPGAADRLCAGPGRLCRAFGVDRQWNGLPLARSAKNDANNSVVRCVWIAAGPASQQVVAGPRVGIRQAVDRPYRFCDPKSPCLSKSPDFGRL